VHRTFQFGEIEALFGGLSAQKNVATGLNFGPPNWGQGGRLIWL